MKALPDLTALLGGRLGVPVRVSEGIQMENSDTDRQLEPVSDPVVVGTSGENIETGTIE